MYNRWVWLASRRSAESDAQRSALNRVPHKKRSTRFTRSNILARLSAWWPRLTRTSPWMKWPTSNWTGIATASTSLQQRHPTHLLKRNSNAVKVSDLRSSLDNRKWRQRRTTSGIFRRRTFRVGNAQHFRTGIRSGLASWTSSAWKTCPCRRPSTAPLNRQPCQRSLDGWTPSRCWATCVQTSGTAVTQPETGNGEILRGVAPVPAPSR